MTTDAPLALHVRRAGLADVDALVPMMVEFNRHEAIKWAPETGRPVLERLIGDPSLGIVLVGVGVGVGDGADAAAVHGYAVVTWGFDLEWGGRDSFLTELFLVEAARGRGAGRALLAGAEAAALAEGARAMHLMVRFDNTAARALYDRAGFEDPRRALLSKRLG